jgi:serine protease AprX
VAREEYAPAAHRDYGHGSFVAGLIAQPRRLNQGDARFPETSAKIVDVVAIPTGGISEDELLTILEEVLPKHPDVRVWNLSLGGSTCCDDRAFSDLAIKLDDLQDRYDVTFVLAAGNYEDPPLRGWPPDDYGEADRICSPADSLRGITVGSIAHLHRPSYRVGPDHPSPFSRRGPGPVFVPKPEIVHLGGNCDDTGQYLQTGVMSLDGAGQLAENIGTSFAAPLVSTLVANIDSSLQQRAGRNLLKALVIHSAMLQSEKLTGEEIRYRGFGKPNGNPVDVLSCLPWSATLVFEPELIEGIDFVRAEFPIPPSFRTPSGKVRGGLVMTLVYDPQLNGSFGAEYCRTNVEASLGTYDVGADGKRHHRGQVPPEPRDMAKLYERQLIEHGFKWSPVKVYRRIIKKGIKGDEWRLNVSLTQRSGFATTEAQKAAILVTLYDPLKQAPIYNEVSTLMAQLGWATANLDVQARLRT